MNGHLWKGRNEEKRHVRDLSQVKKSPARYIGVASRFEAARAAKLKSIGV